VCALFWTNANCSVELLCNYWDEARGLWSSEGLVASPPPGGVPDGLLHCESTHLTDFGGVIRIPMSAEELLAELSEIKFNTFTLDEMASVLSEFDVLSNPAIFSMVFISTLLDMLLVAWSHWRWTRRRTNKKHARVVKRQLQRDPEYMVKRAIRERARAQDQVRLHARALLLAKERGLAFSQLPQDMQPQVAALFLQAKVRSRTARTEAVKNRMAALKLQAAVRGRLARRAAADRDFAGVAHNMASTHGLQWQGDGSECLMWGRTSTATGLRPSPSQARTRALAEAAHTGERMVPSLRGLVRQSARTPDGMLQQSMEGTPEPTTRRASSCEDPASSPVPTSGLLRVPSSPACTMRHHEGGSGVSGRVRRRLDDALALTPPPSPPSSAGRLDSLTRPTRASAARAAAAPVRVTPPAHTAAAAQNRSAHAAMRATAAVVRHRHSVAKQRARVDSGRCESSRGSGNVNRAPSARPEATSTHQVDVGELAEHTYQTTTTDVGSEITSCSSDVSSTRDASSTNVTRQPTPAASGPASSLEGGPAAAMMVVQPHDAEESTAIEAQREGEVKTTAEVEADAWAAVWAATGVPAVAEMAEEAMPVHSLDPRSPRSSSPPSQPPVESGAMDGAGRPGDVPRARLATTFRAATLATSLSTTTLATSSTVESTPGASPLHNGWWWSDGSTSPRVEHGPVSRQELLRLHARGKIVDETHVRCARLDTWQPFCQVLGPGGLYASDRSIESERAGWARAAAATTALGAFQRLRGQPRTITIEHVRHVVDQQDRRAMWRQARRRGGPYYARFVARQAWAELRVGWRQYLRQLQSDHTIVSAVAPNAEDTAGDRLRDENIVHIFFTLLMSELCLLSFLAGGEGAPLISIVTAVNGLIATAVSCSVAISAKYSFRFGNRQRWRAPYRPSLPWRIFQRLCRARRELRRMRRARRSRMMERAARRRETAEARQRMKGPPKVTMDLKGKWVIPNVEADDVSDHETGVLSGPARKYLAAAGVVGGRGSSRVVRRQGNRSMAAPSATKKSPSADAVSKVGDKRWIEIPVWQHRARFAMAWAFNILVYVVASLIAITYGVLLSQPDFSGILIAWLASLGFTWLFVEPSQALGIVVLPRLIPKGPRFAACRRKLLARQA